MPERKTDTDWAANVMGWHYGTTGKWSAPRWLTAEGEPTGYHKGSWNPDIDANDLRELLNNAKVQKRVSRTSLKIISDIAMLPDMGVPPDPPAALRRLREKFEASSGV